MRILCALLLLWALSAGADPQEDARAALDHCIAKFGHRDDVYFKELTAQCADLPAALAGSDYARWLPEHWWSESLTLQGLDELGELMQAREEAGPTSVDPALLGPILSDLKGRELTRHHSLMERFRAWLLEHLRPERNDSEPSWFIEWLDKLARHTRLIDIISWTIFGLLVVAAVVIVVNELRAAGLLGRRSGQAAAARRGAAAHAGGGVPGIDDLDAIDAAQRPSLLMELIVAALAGPGRPGDRALTHRELQRKVQAVAPSVTRGFDLLARCAELLRYSSRKPPSTEIDAAVASGRDVLSALSRPVARA